MSYYFKKELSTSFQDAIELVTKTLKVHGFGILTEIDVQATLKNKINVDLYKYTILGACNPSFAHKAILAEDKIGIMLPCNIIVQQKSPDAPVEVSAVDPIASMGAVDNPKLGELSREVQKILKQVIADL